MTENAINLTERIKRFSVDYLAKSNWIKGNNPLKGINPFFIPAVRNELEKEILLPAGFSQCTNEDKDISEYLFTGFYVRSKQDSADLFVVDNLFADFFEAESSIFAVKHKPQKQHYLSLIKLGNNQQVEELIKRHYNLAEIWNDKGLTHRTSNLYNFVASIPVGAGMLGGGVLGLRYFRDIGFLISTLIGCGIGIGCSEIMHKMRDRNLESIRTKIKMQYNSKLQSFKQDYEAKTIFDNEALEYAVKL